MGKPAELVTLRIQEQNFKIHTHTNLNKNQWIETNEGGGGKLLEVTLIKIQKYHILSYTILYTSH